MENWIEKEFPLQLPVEVYNRKNKAWEPARVIRHLVEQFSSPPYGICVEFPDHSEELYGYDACCHEVRRNATA